MDRETVRNNVRALYGHAMLRMSIGSFVSNLRPSVERGLVWNCDLPEEIAECFCPGLSSFISGEHQPRDTEGETPSEQPHN